MRYIILLVVLLACTQEELIKQSNYRCFKMVVSDAIPIQFWVEGEQTFNESNPICGLTNACFCQPFNCDDEIVLQISDDIEGQEVNLLIKDSEGNTLETIAFDSTEIFVDEEEEITLQFSNTDFPGNIDGWSSFNGSDRSSGGNYGSFAYSGVDAVASGGNIGSKYFAIQREDNPSEGWPPGDYVVSIRGSAFWDGVSGEADAEVYGMEDSATETSIIGQIASGTFPSDDSEVTRTITFTLSQYYPYLAFTFTADDGGALDFSMRIEEIILTTSPTVTETTEVYSKTVYSASVIPSELGICSEMVSMEIVGDEETWRSDCLDMRNSHQCSKLMEYTNSDDFDGIVYDVSPQPVFYLRVPAQLLEDENPQTQEDLELSNGVIVTVRQTIQEKSIFKLGFMPPYMHTKVQKALMHDTPIIDNVQWKRRDPYEAPRVEDYPLKKGEVLLTKYNSVLKNTI